MKKIIPEALQRIKGLLSGDLFMILLILLVGFASFGLGRLSAIEEGREGVEIRYPDSSTLGASAVGAFDSGNTGSITTESIPAASSQGVFVASINGSKYHFPWCSGAKRIKSENLIQFDTREEAERAGYTKAANCKGL